MDTFKNNMLITLPTFTNKTCQYPKKKAYTKYEQGPNYLQTLNVTRGASVASVKQSFRKFSLNSHPDKTYLHREQTGGASEMFIAATKMKDVLLSPKECRAYDRRGEASKEVKAGAKASSANVDEIDEEKMIIRMIIYYVFSLAFIFFINYFFVHPKMDAALRMTICGLLLALLFEVLFVFDEYSLPQWLFPFYTLHNIVMYSRRFYPACMSVYLYFKTAWHVDDVDASKNNKASCSSPSTEKIGGKLRAKNVADVKIKSTSNVSFGGLRLSTGIGMLLLVRYVWYSPRKT